MQKEESSGKIFDKEILSKVFVFVKPYWSKFVLLIICTISVGAVATYRPLLVQQSVDHYILRGQFDGLVGMSMAILAVILIQALLDYSTTYLSGFIGQSIIRDIRVKLYAHLVQFRLSFFDKTPIGRLITRNISDIETISDIFTEGIADIAGAIIQLIFILGVMFYMDWRLTLISLSVIPFLILSTYVFKEKVKNSFNDVRLAVANLNTFVQEHVTGMNIVQIFNSEERELKKFKEINKEHRNANLRSVMYYSIYFPIAEVLSAAGIGLLIWWGAHESLTGTVSMGMLIAFIMYINMFFRPIREIADKFNTLQMGIVGSSRVIALLENNAYLATSGNHIPHEVQGNISFNDVHFGYTEDAEVLKGISFDLKSGKTLALVGATGAGKSSIIGLINRFYEIQKGNISVDNVDISDWNLEALRSKIGLVHQDVFLFSDSIRNNITLGNPTISDAQIWHAAKNIGAELFIKKLPGQLDYQVMERGATLSLGQRQMISFIRAMVYDPAIIILDEATSSVDSETEDMIQKAIAKMLAGRTSIVIAHRLSTIQHADEILVIDKGTIAERGTHDTLIKQDGLYARLCKMQFEFEVA